MNPAHTPNNLSKCLSAPPPYTEFAGYTSAQPSSPGPSSRPPPQAYRAVSVHMPVDMPPQVHPHPGYGPTPLGTNQPLLPYAYYAPRDIANSRTRWRFITALFWALVFYSILGCWIGVGILGVVDSGQWFRNMWMRVGSMIGDGAVSFADA